MRLTMPVVALAFAACGSPPPAPEPSPPAPPPPAAPPPAAQKGVFLEDIDRSADPCTDFFAFANGAWRKQNPIPASNSRWSRRWQAGESAKERLKDILDAVSARRDWPAASAEQQIGDFYASCMDEGAVERAGLEPLKPLLAEIAAVNDRAGLVKTIARLEAIGVHAPFALGGESDLHAPADVVAWLSPSGLGLPDRDYYVKADPRFVEARRRYVEHVATTFGLAGRDAKAAKRAAGAVMALETELAKASLDNVALRDPKASDHKMTVAELRKLAPNVDWAALLGASGLKPDPLNVTQPAFVKEVDRRLGATPLADWKTYLEWRVIEWAADLLPKAFVDEQFEFAGKFLSGAKERKPRWKRCVELTDNLLGEALGKKYVEKYFPPAAKARMQLLVKNLLAAMKDTVDNLDWMGPQTKQKALEKLATFNPKIGYPDTWKDYASVPIERDALFANALAASKWNVDDNHATVGKPVDRGRWGMTPPTSDAYYNPALNEIVFPAGILQPPAFDVDASDAVNYGAIGVVIGHEISHGFDDQGAQYDALGRLENWWTPDDLERFRARGQCVVDQYEGYFIEPGIHHNGKLVLGESIGDLGGANLAYRAFKKAQQQAPAGPGAGGYTLDQQFFIAWGQFRGDEIRPEQQRLMVQGDPHPVAKYRVVGPIANMPAFAQAFSCKADAPMVRAEGKRCEVW
jgi:putative endopeptidase